MSKLRQPIPVEVDGVGVVSRLVPGAHAPGDLPHPAVGRELPCADVEPAARDLVHLRGEELVVGDDAVVSAPEVLRCAVIGRHCVIFCPVKCM